MLLKQKPPELVLFQPNKSTPISQIIAPQHIDTTYRFGTASEMQFKIQKFLYDERSNEWYKNPSYDYAVSNNLICSSEDSDIFKFKGCKLLTGNTSYRTSMTQSRSRDSSRTGLFFSVDMEGCTLQNEYAIFNLGLNYGYNWKRGTYINDSGALISAPNDASYTMNEALEEFLPVEVGDIIALGSRPYAGYFKKNETVWFRYRIHYYSAADASKQTKVSGWLELNPVGRIVVEDGDFGSDTYLGMNNRTVTKYEKSGYIRLELQCMLSNISYPLQWEAAIISGERRCTSVSVQKENNEDKYFDVSFGAPWWVIKDVQEEIDGFNSVKTVTAYSYEYTVSNKTFSIEECTLPLFIPDAIPTTINSSAFFCIDSCDGIDCHGRQRMERGLINRILDICPEWSIGYVTPKLMTRYRSVPDCSEVNVYTFLFSTIQELYKCFIIFNSNDMTISLIDMDDIVSIDSDAVITWRNALKSLTITNTDTNYVTALRVHAGDDKYGIGLVNPNGTNVIYNFDSIADKLDYVADNYHVDENNVPYTLLDRWNAYKDAITDIQNGTISVAGTTISEARQRVINGQFEILEIEERISEALTNYQKLADRINVLLDYDDESRYKRLPDIPIRSFTGEYEPASSTNPNTGTTAYTYNNYSSETLYNEIREASQLYYETLSEYNLKLHDLSGAIKDLKEFSIKLSLSPSVLQPILVATRPSAYSNEIGDGYFPVFTPTEAKEMSKYIIEGTWTNDNIVFNEDYNATDIMTTLFDVFNVASFEFNNIYSKPTYDFSASIAGMFASEEIGNLFRNMALGNSLYIVDDSAKKQFNYIKPVLLAVHANYDDWGNSSFELSTDYKRKPLEIRFTELFGMISQVNPSNASFTYND